MTGPKYEEVLIDADGRQTSLCEDAMRELSAFFRAVKLLYGEPAAAAAIDYWLAAFELETVQLERSLPMCRQVTIAAASRLADDRTLVAGTGMRTEAAFTMMAGKHF